MKENYIITIDGLQAQDGEESSVSLSTRGSYVCRNGKYYISYEETEATGFAGCTTTVKVEQNKKVSMLRYGPAPSQLIIESGKRHLCHYGTGEGSLMLGISAGQIVNRLAPRGGHLEFSYTLDVNAVDVSTNNVKITVREVQ